MKALNGRDIPKVPLCGHCAGAAESTSVRKAHDRCPEHLPCACRDNGHKVNAELAGRMAKYCHTTVDVIYARHGQKQRVITDERRAQLAEQLVRARAAKQVAS